MSNGIVNLPIGNTRKTCRRSYINLFEIGAHFFKGDYHDEFF